MPHAWLLVSAMFAYSYITAFLVYVTIHNYSINVAGCGILKFNVGN